LTPCPKNLVDGQDSIIFLVLKSSVTSMHVGIKEVMDVNMCTTFAHKQLQIGDGPWEECVDLSWFLLRQKVSPAA
jgi:hypothetical protein